MVRPIPRHRAGLWDRHCRQMHRTSTTKEPTKDGYKIFWTYMYNQWLIFMR